MKTRISTLLVAAGSLFAQTPSRAERGRQIVDEAIKALGGRAFLEVKDRTETGRVYSFYREQLRGLSVARIYTRYLTPPAPPARAEGMLVRERQSFGKKEEEYAVLFDEFKGWQITFRGARPLPAETLERYQDSTRRNFFYIVRERLGEGGLTMEYQGAEVIENTPVSVVEINDAANNSVLVHFHQSTKLPVRQIFHRRDAQRVRHEEMTVFSKYRDVGGGVMWPYSITRFRDGEKIFEIFSESVVINQDLDDQLFTLPASMKILPPQK